MAPTQMSTRRLRMSGRFGDVTLVPRMAVLQLEEEDALRFLARLDDPGCAAAVRALVRDHLGEDVSSEHAIAVVARMLARGELIAIELDDDASGGMPPSAAEQDWDEIPSLSELLPRQPPDSPPPSSPRRTIDVEVVDYTGIPFAGATLQARYADSTLETVVLDEHGRWHRSDLSAASAVTLVLPEGLELAFDGRREKPRDAAASNSAELHVARGAASTLALATDRSHRIVVDPPVAQPTMSMPASLFPSDSAFPLPGIVHLVTFAQELVDGDPDARIGLFGHADTTGDADANKQLAERRAAAAYALLTGEYATFDAVARAEPWPMASYQVMLRVLGCNPSAIDGEGGVQTAAAIAEFCRAYNRDTWHDEGRARVFGTIPASDTLDETTKYAIVDAYHAELSGRLDANRFIGPRHMGCGEFNPLGADHAQNRRVTLAIYGADAPADSDFPCRANDVAACEIDEGGSFRCRFYRERIRESGVREDLDPFWDLQWLSTATGKAHMSALTHFADTNDATFVVRRLRRDASVDADSGTGPAPEDGTEIARLGGLIRGGVAYALWPYPDGDDPFDAQAWFRPTPGGLLREYLPYHFTVAAHGAWGLSDAPSFPLASMSLAAPGSGLAFGLAPNGDVLLLDEAELADAKKARVSSLRLQARRTGGFER